MATRLVVLSLLSLTLPFFVRAQTVASVNFTSDAQSIPVAMPSSPFTIQAQAGGQSVSLPQTGCVAFESSSPTGQFSSSATNWNSVSVLSMNKGTANKNFYYKDSSAGTFTLSVHLVIKPDTESSSCASWPREEWGTTFDAIQAVVVGSTGSNNSTDSTTQSQSTGTSVSQESTAASAYVSSYVPPPVPQVFADGGDDRVVIVGADTVFTGRAYNRTREEVEHVRFLWNFGDGSTAEGPSVLHHYDYPGKYAAVLTIADNRESPSDYFTVTAEPAKLAFFVYADGSVGIQNLAGRDLDLSSWIVKSFNQLFVLPEHSRIFAGETMRVSQQTLKFWSSIHTELAYPNGVVALRAVQATSGPQQQTVSTPALAPAPAATPIVSARPVAASPVAEVDATEPVQAAEEVVSTSSQAAAAALAGGYWWLGVCGLALALSGVVVLVRRFRDTEWDIEEA